MNRKLLSLFALCLGLGGAAVAQVESIGLSAVRGQRFGGAVQPTLPAQAEDLFAFAIASGDFDGDGIDDLATGASLDDGPLGAEVPDAGLVVVRYGVARLGLGSEVSVLSQSSIGGLEEGDFFGTALAACDFDGDSFDDLAVGSPGESLGPNLVQAGAVIVFYGSSTGLADRGVQFFTQDSVGVPETAESHDRLGDALACGDFDGDGHADLAAGMPGEAIGIESGSGAILVLHGSSAGLDATTSFEIDQDQALVTGDAEANDRFGAALAAGDFDGDGFDDLAVGAPGEDESGGAFHVFFGAATGLARSDDVYRDETGLGGQAEDGDQFALSLSTGDLNGDGDDDLLVGIPTEDLGTASNCGRIGVLYGAPGGFDFDHPQFWSQDDILGASTSETDDFFGISFAAGDFDRDGNGDLAVGSFGEFVTGPLDGVVVVLMGSPAGLTAARHRAIAAGLDGFPGDAAQHERAFGFSLVAGAFDGDAHRT